MVLKKWLLRIYYFETCIFLSNCNVSKRSSEGSEFIYEMIKKKYWYKNKKSTDKLQLWKHLLKIVHAPLVKPKQLRSDKWCLALRNKIWGIWRPGWRLVLFAVVLKPFQSSFYALPPESALAIKGSTWSAAVFGWVVDLQWHPHRCQDPRFPSRTCYCNNMINVTHI